MLNQKQILSTQPPVVGQIWLSQDTKNYYRIDAVDDELIVTVQRVAYESNGQVFRGRENDRYFWPVSGFESDNFRVVATNPTRFESWLNRVTK